MGHLGELLHICRKQKVRDRVKISHQVIVESHFFLIIEFRINELSFCWSEKPAGGRFVLVQHTVRASKTSPPELTFSFLMFLFLLIDITPHLSLFFFLFE